MNGRNAIGGRIRSEEAEHRSLTQRREGAENGNGIAENGFTAKNTKAAKKGKTWKKTTDF